MRFVLVIIVCFSQFIGCVVQAQTIELDYQSETYCKRASEIVLETEKKIDELDIKEITAFLKVIGKCENYVEFQEFSNSVLIRIIHKYPRVVLEILQYDRTINRERVFSELSAPLLDIDLIKLDSIFSMEIRNMELFQKQIKSLLNDLKN